MLQVKSLQAFFFGDRKSLEETKMSFNRKHSMKHLHKGMQCIKKCPFRYTIEYFPNDIVGA